MGLEAEGQGGGAGAAVQTLGPRSPGSRRPRGQACRPAGAELRGRVWASLGTALTAAHHAAGLTSGHWSHRNGVLLPGGWRQGRVVIPDGFKNDPEFPAVCGAF